jgi:hypothetical protein
MQKGEHILYVPLFLVCQAMKEFHQPIKSGLAVETHHLCLKK